MYKKGLDIPCNKGDNDAETLNKRRIDISSTKHRC